MSSEDFPQFWEDIYKKNDTGWDLGGPTPIFEKLASKLEPEDMIVQSNDFVSPYEKSPSRLNVLWLLSRFSSTKYSSIIFL